MRGPSRTTAGSTGFAQPEARYWFCQAYSGHFVGAHLLGGQYNYGNLDMPFKFLGTDFRKLKGVPIPGLDGRSGYRLWLFVDSRQALEHRGRNRHRLGIYPI